jgi:hypothetical protein
VYARGIDEADPHTAHLQRQQELLQQLLMQRTTQRGMLHQGLQQLHPLCV